MTPIILIPARMNSTRLPGKPLADIAGKPMIVHVLERARAANAGEVAVACDGAEIAEAVEKAGGKSVLTDPAAPSGSDRIWQALQSLDAEAKFDAIVNVQGDMPLLDPHLVMHALAALEESDFDIVTLAAVITDEAEKNDPAVVKAVIAQDGRALYFTRTAAPYGDGPLYHHIGIYAYRRAALERFVKLPPSPLEQREKLEQLRALEAGMRIGVRVVDTVPLGVDTPEGLEKARALAGRQ